MSRVLDAEAPHESLDQATRDQGKAIATLTIRAERSDTRGGFSSSRHHGQFLYEFHLIGDLEYAKDIQAGVQYG